ncbi:hypothetical protein ACWIEX_16230 [Bosea sp. NPDC055353]
MSVAEHVGPISVEMPIISDGIGRNRGGYRTQLLPLVASGRMLQTYAPPRNLWVDGLGNIRWGQPLRFLVDPDAGLVYEATSAGKILLLSYDRSFANLSESARNRSLIGLGFLAFAAWQLGTLLYRRRQDRSARGMREG